MAEEFRQTPQLVPALRRSDVLLMRLNKLHWGPHEGWTEGPEPGLGSLLWGMEGDYKRT